jgi:phosphate transport system substrate-binding protein
MRSAQHAGSAGEPAGLPLPARPLAALLLLPLLLAAMACTAGDAAPLPPRTVPPGGIPADIGREDSAALTGAGATFPAPIYQAWFEDYYHNVARGVKVNYQSIGSGAGIFQFSEGTVDFGATDAPMTDAQVSKAGDVQHIPMVLGAVVLTYNLPGLAEPLRLDGPTVAAIFLDKVRRWNDPAIAAQNPGVELPGDEIQVVHRSDGSGTTFAFTDWLTKVSPEWASRVGASKNPSWPAGQGGKGNEGVTNIVGHSPTAIGYVELNYALANGLTFAAIRNRAGNYVLPSVETAGQAAAGVDLPEDYRVSITDSAADNAYPIASFTYLLVHRDRRTCGGQAPLVHLLWWVFHAPEAASTAAELNYAPLPSEVLPRIDATLKSLRCAGQPVLPR